jgi:uncharacterized protein DUF4439
VSGPGAAGTSRPGIAALQAALAAEQAACYGYGVVGAYLSGGEAAKADADWIAHQQARDGLTATITAEGADPVPAAVAYRLPIPVHSAGQARALAVLLEERVAQAYIGLVGLSDLTLRALGARQLRAAALRAAAWNHVTMAFPGLPDSSPGDSGTTPAISAPG